MVARPLSNSPPRVLSMFMTRHTALPTKLLRPNMLQVTWVRSPSGLNVNSAVLVAANGFRNSSLMRTISLGRLSTIVMRPSPTLLLPAHAKDAPVPAGAPSNEFLTEGSSFAHGDQACQL